MTKGIAHDKAEKPKEDIMRLLRTTATILLVLLVTALLASAATAPTMNLVDTAAKTANLSSFTKAVQAAGLTAAFKQPGPFTVFAPTNAAFAKVPKTTLNNLMKPENKTMLRSLLLYHVIKGKVTAEAIMKMKSKVTETTLQGQMITISHSKTMIMVNNAMVVKPDIMATNGVIHEIDTVLMPPKK